MVRPMVHSKKHYAQFSIANVTAGATASKTIVVAVAPEDVDTSVEVVEGATVKAVYLEIWASVDDAVNGSAIFAVQKRPSGHAVIAAGEFAALQDYDNKRNVLEVHQGLLPGNTNNPMNIFRHWIKIPKGKQRFGLGDILSVEIFAQSDGVTFCGFATYKEYT